MHVCVCVCVCACVRVCVRERERERESSHLAKCILCWFVYLFVLLVSKEFLHITVIVEGWRKTV